MCNNGVYDDLTAGFIRENIACQKGKGQDMAFRIVVQFLQQLHREAPGADVFGEHIDIRQYFPTTPQEKVKENDRKRIKEKLFIQYLDEIIDMQGDSRPADEIAKDPFGKRGTGLGSQINQLNQVSLLDSIDHEIKAICPCYIRYNDDFLVLSHDKGIVRICREIIRERATEYGLTLKPDEGVFKACNGFYFLRKRFIMSPTGKITIRLHRKALAEERQTLRNLKLKVDQGVRDMDAVKRHYQSWVANAEYAGDAPIRVMDRFYTQLFRQKPVYKRKKRYLYGHDRSKGQRADSPARSGEPAAGGGESAAEVASGLQFDDRDA